MMEKDLIKDYLEKSMFTEVQAEALSRIFDTWTSRFVTKEELAEMEARMTWRIIGAMAFMAALMTVLDAFID